MISVILPSRSRPDKAYSMVSEWNSKAAGLQFQWVFSLDTDDPKLGDYSRLATLGEVLVNDNQNAVQAINRAAEQAQGDILIVASDDFSCPDNWTRRIEKHCAGRQDFVLKTWDGIQLWLVTLPILDRVYYNRFGYIYHPSYAHMFSDCEFSHVADLLHKLQFRNDIIFRHNHHSVDPLHRKDAVTIKAEQTTLEGCSNYLQRARKRFGLSFPDLYAISKEGADHKRWMKAHGL